MLMKDLTNPLWIKVKGLLFLLLGFLSALLLVLDRPSLKICLLLIISIWCFCRFYYFAFYVIEKYVDPGFRFSGLWSFIGYLARGKSIAPTNDGDRFPMKAHEKSQEKEC
jgi:hypothetical protein